MDDQQIGRQILWLTACIMAGFGLVVLIGSVVGRKRGRSPRALLVKYLAWFLLIPPILLPLLYSRVLFQVVVLLLSLQCIREFAVVTGLWSDRRAVWLCCSATVGIYVPVFAGWYGGHQAGAALAVGLLLLLPIARGRYDHMLQKVSLSVLAVVYFGWFLSHLAYLRNLAHGIVCVFFLLVLVECNDAFGYLWGKWLGRHKLSPRISPNKTVEGAVCGAASVLLVAYLLGCLLPGVGGLRGVLAAMLISVLAICGDLVVSFIKRDVRVKDMGSAIPGHGGFLDRADSLILAAPAFFHVTRIFYEA